MTPLLSIILGLIAILLVLSVPAWHFYQLKKAADERTAAVSTLAQRHGWQFTADDRSFDDHIHAEGLGYMQGRFPLRNFLTQQRDQVTLTMFDCAAVTPISAVAIQRDGAAWPAVKVIERLIEGRWEGAAADFVEPSDLPKFVGSKVRVHAPSGLHAAVGQLIEENGELQRVFKRRDVGYVAMREDRLIVYFLTQYPAEEREFSKMLNKIKQIRLLGADKPASPTSIDGS